MAVSSKRPEHVALVSLILSVASFGIAFLVGRWSNFFAVYSMSWLMLSSALIWLVLCLQFHQRALAEQEKLDMGQLSKDESASTIFQAMPPVEAAASTPPAKYGLYPTFFINGMVKEPVATVLATALPETDPIKPLAKTAIFAGPPTL